MSDTSAWKSFRKEIQQAQALLQEQQDAQATAESPNDVLASALPNLLEQCREVVRTSKANTLRPMRSIHHFACSGGTLISRCLAAMPNTQLLSEVDPLSTVGQRETFVPTSLIRLAQHGSRPPSQDVLVDIFLAGLDVLSNDARQNGFDMVLRDHAHSQFCLGSAVLERPTLGEMLDPHYALRSVVSIRHPLDSYLSMEKLDWIRFTPRTLEEYARRYDAFLDRYAGIDIVRYEEFVENPEAQIQRICSILGLQYNADFLHVFAALRLSGDSGRGGGEISARKRRNVTPDMLKEIDQSPAFKELCNKLGYDISLE